MDRQEEELRALRSGVRDLTALSALPLMWIGKELPAVGLSFLDIVLASLRADLAYARLEDPRGGCEIEVARAEADPHAAERAHEIGQALTPALASLNGASGSVVVPNPLNNQRLRIAFVPLRAGARGVVAAGSHRADFPTAMDTSLLSAAVNQLTICLRSARAAVEQARAEAALMEHERMSHRLAAENTYLREEIQSAISPGGIVGRSSAIRKVLVQVQLVAPTEATVLVVGESGTGKELVAREIHRRSTRANQPLIKVNCSAIPRDMFESEFFGHIRGAFTGALRDRPGRFQVADGGTIFLDEIGDLPLEMQPKLLRMLQEGQYERVGDDTTREVNVRVIAATNRELPVELKAGRFREDLYYRLNVFAVRVPPLRERKDDIPLLTRHLAALSAQKLRIEEPSISDSQCDGLKAYDWPGNVRELGNFIERTMILTRDGCLRFDRPLTDLSSHERGSPDATAPLEPVTILKEDEWRRRERANILAAIERADGRIQGPGGAADLLGLRPSTLQSRLRAFGIQIGRKTVPQGEPPPHFAPG
jgi:transcriptional regulator with GAF, ATPase, and Fis domain